MTEPPRTEDQVPTGTPGEQAAAPRPRPTPGPAPASGVRPTPGPRPSPTSRARRTAAGAPDGLRRPRPAPVTEPAVREPAVREPAASEPAAGEPDTAGLQTSTATAGPERGEAAVDLGKETRRGGSVADPASHRDAGLLHPSAVPRGRPGGPGAPVWLAAALVVLLLALAGLDGWLLTHQPSKGSKSEREQALSTAKTAVPLILSYDYRHFDSDVSAGRGRLTGRAVQDYVQAMAKTIKPTAAKVHAVVQAQTDGAGVEAVSGNGKQVTVVVFGEQKVTNTSVTAPRIDLFRVRVTLDLVAGQWLVSKFDQI